MREICTSGSVGGEGGNILAYPALKSRHHLFHSFTVIPALCRAPTSVNTNKLKGVDGRDKPGHDEVESQSKGRAYHTTPETPGAGERFLAFCRVLRTLRAAGLVGAGV